MIFKGTTPIMIGAPKTLPAWARTAAAGLALLLPAGAVAQDMGGHAVSRGTWSFAGPLGHFDAAQLQRGYKVYKEVCAACHSLRLVKYRNLAEPGGPAFTEGQVKTLISDVVFEDAIDDNGNPAKRPAVLADAFKGPFANDNAARAANNGALPPDLSLMAKAREQHSETAFYNLPIKWLKEISAGRQENGVDYIHALLTGYHDLAPAYVMDANGKLTLLPEAQATKDSLRCASVNAGEGVGADGKPLKDECIKVGEGLYYNTTFPGHQIAMPAPLASDGQVAYTDGTPATVDQYARDISAFLMWSADPKLDERKDLGLRMMIYLLILSGLLWLAKRHVWKRLH
jgi:ubiquinol-cytochrome c reductase cytochrome c1 subunit